MTSEYHGVDLVDDITTRIDAALSGYDGQHAGDLWFDANGVRSAYDYVDRLGNFDTTAMSDIGVTFNEAFNNIRAAMEEMVATIGPVIAQAQQLAARLFGDAPVNDFRDRWTDWFISEADPEAYDTFQSWSNDGED